VVIPTDAAAKDHWAISTSLITALSTGVAKNTFVLTVKLPDGFAGGTCNLSYRAKTESPDGKGYTSGSSAYVSSSSSIVTFKGTMHTSSWNMTLSLFKKIDQVQVGDIFSFYQKSGFSQTPVELFPLEVSGDGRVLQADLSGSSGVKVTRVNTVSGDLVLPKLLPDGTDLITFPVKANQMKQFTLFATVVNSSKESLAAYNVTLPMDTTKWVPANIDGVDYYRIPYSTTFLSGYFQYLQLYYGVFTTGTNPQWDAISYVYLTSSVLNTDLTGQDFKVSKWNTRSSNMVTLPLPGLNSSLLRMDALGRYSIDLNE